MAPDPARGHRNPRLPASPFLVEPTRIVERYANGDRVVHDEHGLGTVTAIDDTGVTVDFGTVSARIPSPYARMEKL